MTYNIQRLHCAIEINILAANRVATINKQRWDFQR